MTEHPSAGISQESEGTDLATGGASTLESVGLETSHFDPVSMGTASFGATLILLASFILYSSREIRSLALGNHDPGPKFIPMWCGIILLLGGIAQLYQGLVTEKLREGKSLFPQVLNLRLLITIGGLLGYVVLLNQLGYLVATTLFLIGVLKLFGSKWVEACCSTFVLVAFVYLLFEVVFKVSLPQGLL